MAYDFIRAIQEAIEQCKDWGYGRVKRYDANGNVKVWIEAEWVDYDYAHDIIEVHICYSDTGAIAYSNYIEETITCK